MGNYIPTPEPHGKADFIVDIYGGFRINKRLAETILSNTQSTIGVIIVVDNGPFEAAGFCPNMHEFKNMNDPKDYRPKQFVAIEREIAEKLSGYDHKEMM